MKLFQTSTVTIIAEFLEFLGPFCCSLSQLCVSLHQMKPAWYATSQMNRCFHRFQVFSPA